MAFDKASRDSFESHLSELQKRLDQYESSHDDASKKALIDYAQYTFVPATSSLIKQDEGSEDSSLSSEHADTLKQHLEAIGQHLKEGEGEFDIAMARLNNNALFNFLERLFS